MSPTSSGGTGPASRAGATPGPAPGVQGHRPRVPELLRRRPGRRVLHRGRQTADRGAHCRQRQRAVHPVHRWARTGAPAATHRRASRRPHSRTGGQRVRCRVLHVRRARPRAAHPSGPGCVAQPAAAVGVSVVALLYRCRELETLSEASYKRATMRTSRLGWRTHEPGGTCRSSCEPCLRGRAGGAVRVARGRWPVSGPAWTRYPAGRRARPMRW